MIQANSVLSPWRERKTGRVNSEENFTIGDCCPTGSRLAHLYRLPKTHKRQLAMHPILSATALTTTPLLNGLMLCLSPCR